MPLLAPLLKFRAECPPPKLSTPQVDVARVDGVAEQSAGAVGVVAETTKERGPIVAEPPCMGVGVGDVIEGVGVAVRVGVGVSVGAFVAVPVGVLVARSAFRPAANHGHFGRAETFLDRLKVVFGNLGVGIHQTNEVVAPDQFECRSKAAQCMRLPDVLFISGHVHAERAGDLSRAVAGAVVNDVHIRGQNPSLENAAHRSADAHRLVLRGQHYAKPFHS